MQIIEVGSNRQYQKSFIELPVRLYRDNPYWIRPLDKDVEDIFNPEKNKTFKNGECIRWIALDAQGVTIGRVAAFVNHETASKGNDQPTGGMGLFECVEDEAVAFALFDACKKWLQARKMEAMDGPINFGERDRFWGLLIHGFDKEPLYRMGYHFDYYRAFFENYGYQVYFEQLTYKVRIPEVEFRAGMDKLVMARAERILNNPDYEFVHIRKNELEKFTEDFRIIYNEAWAKHLGTGDMTPDRARAAMKSMKPIMEEKLIWFGYNGGRPVAFFIMLPEVNQVFKYVNGKMDWLGKLKFIYHKIRKTNKKAFGVIFGVVPDFQGRGVESAIAIAFSKIAWRPNYQYEDLEFNWIGDFNPKMLRFSELLGGQAHKRHATFRYLFDRTKPFKRHPMI
jgi:hypothetical protein